MSTEFPEDFGVFDLAANDPAGFDRVLDMLFGPEPTVKVPIRVTAPSFLALEYVCLNDENYAAFIEFLKVRVPDTLDLIGVNPPTIDETRAIITLLVEADPGLSMIS